MAPPRPTPQFGKVHSGGARPNSVNLDATALIELLNRLDEPESKGGSRVKRDFVRWPFRRLAITLGIAHPGGNSVSIRTACRNLSNGGICVLHSSYVHPGSECMVTLAHPVRGDVKVPGKIVRCMHRSGVVHEIGIAFATPIVAKEYVLPDPLSNSFSMERIKANDLQGRVLHVEPSSQEREKFSRYIRETCLSLVEAETLADAIVKCERIDLAVVSCDVPDADPFQTVSKLRSVGFHGPVVMVVPDSSQKTRDKVEGVEVTAFLTQPLSEDLVLRALGDVLLLNRPNAANPGTPAPSKRAA